MFKNISIGLRQQMLLFCGITFTVMLWPSFAYAALLTCAGATPAGGSLFATDPGVGLCVHEFQPLVQHLFSKIICIYARIIDNVLDTIYCSIQFTIKTTLEAVVILYIAIFGVQVLTGQVQLTGGEIMLRTVKLAFVWLFATEASYGIGIGFSFFVAMMHDGIMWVINAIGAAGPAAPAIPVMAPGNVMPAYEFIDDLIYTAITGPFTEAKSEVLGFFIVMMISFFPVFLMGVWFLYETAKLLISCILIFLLAISAIAFLISLSPIFLSFMLFQTTFYLFENWLRYMISYAMQVIIIFAIVVLWVVVIHKFMGFFNDLGEYIFPYDHVLMPANTYQPTDTWGICPHTLGVGPTGPTITCDAPFAPDFVPLSNPVAAVKLVPPSRIMEVKTFIYYVIFHMSSLILICFAFRILMKNANQIARDLVGPAYVPMLGAGFGAEAMGRPTGYNRRALMRSMGGSGGGAHGH